MRPLRAAAVCAVPLTGTFIGASPDVAVVAWVVWLLALLVFAVAMAQARVARSSVSPLLFVVVPAVFYGTLLPWLLARERRTALNGVDYLPWYASAIAISGVAVLAFLVGWTAYSAGRPLRGSIAAVRFPRSKVPAGLALLCATLVLTAIRFGGYGLRSRVFDFGSDRAGEAGATAYLLYAPQYLASVCLYLAFRSKSFRLRMISWTLLFALMLYFFASGVRYVFVVFAVATGLLALWNIKGTLLIPRRYMAVCAAVFFVAIGWVGANRGVRVPGSDYSILHSGLGAMEIINPLAATAATTEQNGFEFGSTYLYLVIQPIPRQLWKEKPTPPLHKFLGQFTDVDEGRAVPVWGEMYFNFGYPGVAVGMVGFGILCAALMKMWLRTRGHVPGLDIVAALALPLLIQVISRGYFVQAVHNTLVVTGFPLLLAWNEKRRLGRLSLAVIGLHARRSASSGAARPARPTAGRSFLAPPGR